MYSDGGKSRIKQNSVGYREDQLETTVKYLNWNTNVGFEKYESHQEIETSSVEFSQTLSTSITEHECDTEVQHIIQHSKMFSSPRSSISRNQFTRKSFPVLAKFHILSLIL